MPNYKNNYITYDEFIALQQFGLNYEGFVKGYGYVYTSEFAISPMHMQINSTSPYAPAGMDQFLLGTMQYVDISEDAVIRSYNITPDDIASRIISSDGDSITINMGNGKYMTLPKDNSNIQINITDSELTQIVSVSATNTLTGDFMRTECRLADIATVFGDGYYQNSTLPVSSSNNNSAQQVGDYLKLGMTGVNTTVGGISTYLVHKGGYYKWNEIWHETKTAGTAWRWQSRWNRGASAFHRTNQINSVAGARKLSNKLTKIGGVLILADIGLSGELKPSHAINAIMLGASTTGVGTIVAGAWFILDFGTMGVNYLINGEAKGISDMIDESIGTYEMYEGIY